jgi:hypothetical protein
VEKVMAKFGELPPDSLEQLPTPDKFVDMFIGHLANSSNAVLQATTIIDATLVDCAACDICRMSRRSLKAHAKSGGLERTLIKANGHSYVYKFARDYGARGFSPRDFVLRVVWKWISTSTLVIVTESFEDDARHPRRSGYVRGYTTVLTKLERIEAVGGTPQTRLTYTQQVDVGGAIPKSIVTKGSQRALIHVSKMRLQYDKSAEVDAASYDALVDMIQRHDESYTDEENKLLRDGQARIAFFDEQKCKKLRMASPSTVAKIAFEKNDSRAWGWSKTSVRTR